MIVDGDYSIAQIVSRNKIVIQLPQTEQTLMDTHSPLIHRKLELTSDELALILAITKQMFEGGANG